VNPGKPTLLTKQMYDQFVDILGLSWEENDRAVKAGLQAQYDFENKVMRAQGREILKRLEAEDRIGIVVLGRPYHNDPGINHEIMEEFQKIGYPALTLASLPIDADILEKLFAEDVRAGLIKDPMDVGDAWKNSYSENTTQKIWAAKYTASESCGARTFQLQVRPRRTDLHGGGRDRHQIRHALLLLQGYR